MKINGPYKIIQQVGTTPLSVEGPTGNHGHTLSNGALCNVLNAAYAYGRMSKEKDFQELLRMASKLRGFDKVFDAWKKARGIE